MLLLVFHFLSTAIPILPSQFPLDHCISPPIAQRTARPHCWVKFALNSKETLCVNQSLWKEWIAQAKPLQLCINPRHLERSQSPSNPSQHEKHFYLTQAADETNRRPVKKDDPFNYWQIHFYVERMRERISQFLSSSDSLGLFRSLILHEVIPTSPLPFLRKLGLVHLMNSTGIHLYAAIQVWSTLLLGLLRLLLVPKYIGMRISRIGSISIGFLLWLLAGARLGMLRPAFVILVRQLAQVLGFRWKTGAPLLLALIGEGLISLFETKLEGTPSGRWVYALAVGGGLFFHKTFSSLHLSLAIGSWLLVALYDIWESNSISLLTPLLSLISLPLICTAAYPAILLTLLSAHWVSFSFGLWILKSLDSITSRILEGLTHLCFLPGNFWMISPQAGLISSLLAFFLVSTQLSKKKEIAASMIILGILTIIRFLYEPKKSHFEPQKAHAIEQLDVGQGDGAIIRGSSVGLVDCGAEYALSESTWVDYFSYQRVRKIDWIFLTHLDEDHTGGIYRLAQLTQIGCIAVSKGELESKRGIKFQKHLEKLGLKATSNFPSCIPYPVLPPLDQPSQRKSQRNENMAAIAIPLQGGGLYLSAGDASQNSERRFGHWISRNFQKKGDSNPRLLKISHHGSHFSSSQSFLELVKPTEAWISSGVSNRYHHPHPEVLERLKKAHIPTRRIDHEGSLRWHCNSP